MAITTRADVFSRLLQGKGLLSPGVSEVTGGNTAGNAGAGGYSLQVHASAIGTTYPSTLIDMPPLPAGLPNELLSVSATALFNAAGPIVLVRLYLMGSLNLAATGNQFTHNAGWTAPLLRTIFGQASQPIALMPMIYVTTATATTAPIFTIKTNAGGAGYVDQDGDNVIGTKTFTMPAAATSAQSGFFLRLEDGDSGVRDITQINVDTAGSAGAADIYGVEFLQPTGSAIDSKPKLVDALFGGLGMTDLKPAVPTSGTVPSLLGAIALETGARTMAMHVAAVLNS